MAELVNLEISSMKILKGERVVKYISIIGGNKVLGRGKYTCDVLFPSGGELKNSSLSIEKDPANRDEDIVLVNSVKITEKELPQIKFRFNGMK